MKFFILSFSPKPQKKYMVQIDGKIIHFGDSRYSDFLMNQDPERKKRYLARHFPRENWNDIYTPAFWSRWLLWNEPTMEESLKDIEKRFKLSINPKNSS